MPKFADRVKISSTSTGTGTLTLGSAISGFQSIPASLDGETVGYVIENGSTWELGTGTYTHSGTTLSRTYRSSSTGALLNLTGTSTIFLTPAAQDLQIVHVYSAASDLPNASANHGMVAHVHSLGRMVFAHAGNWINLANASEIVTYVDATTSAAGLMSTADKTKLDAIAASANNYVHPNHTGEVTSAADGATVISDNVVDEANLKVSNSPVNGYVLTAQSGNTGGLTWAAASSGGGGGSATSALSEQEFTATANQTVFTVSGGITNAANVAVFLNGSKLGASDYTASASSNNVTLAAGATVGDLVEISEFGQEAGGASVTSSDTAPSSPSAGDLWFDSSTAELLVYYADGSSNQWVTVSGEQGPTGQTGAAGSSGSSIAEVANIAALQAISNPSAGDQALVTSTNNLYIRKSSPSGWFKIATITNTNPQNFAIAFSGGGSGTAAAYALAADGSTTTTVTSSATADPEGETISFGVIAGSSTNLSAAVTDGGAAQNVTFGGNTIATISQSGAVFTLTPHASNAATGVNLNFTATDGVNTAVESAASFNLAFTTYAYGDRGITAGGDGATASRNRIEYYSIPTSGTVSTFGNLTFTVVDHAGVGNGSRVAFGGGRQFYATTDTIDYIVTATTGNAVDHGNLTEGRWGVAAAGNVNRSLFSGGRSGTSYVELNTVDYKDISTAANCSDFGNLTNAIRYGAGLAGETRALFAGGVFNNNSGAINIDYFTIGSTGNATDFGDLVNGNPRVGCGGTSNNVRGLFVGGAAVNNQSNHMDYVTISTPSNATDFGNLATAVYSPSGAANDTYATFAAGNSASNPYRYTTIQRVAIATLGNASAFGNIADAAGKKAGASGSAA